jgi:hypothetical protein
VRSTHLLCMAVWLLFTGCATVSSRVERTGPEEAPFGPDTPIAAYFNGMGPRAGFVELGHIRVESTASIGEVLQAAAARAREIGADAILVDFRYHYGSVPVTFDASGAPMVPPTPRLNANVVAVRVAP